MKKSILSIACLLMSVPALAAEYDCHSISQEVLAYLVFDGGPGGLDAANVTVYGKEYSDTVFDTTSSVQEISDRKTNQDTFEYGNGKLEIGFSAKKGGLELDIFVDRIYGRVLDGSVFVKQGHHKTKEIAFTCLEK